MYSVFLTAARFTLKAPRLLELRFAHKRLTFKFVINPNCTVAFDIKAEGASQMGTPVCPEGSGTFKEPR